MICTVASIADQPGKSTERRLEVAKHYELVAQRRLKPQRVRETLAELYRQIYGESVPTATLRNYVADWLAIKEHEAARASIVAYRKSADKFTAHLGTCADLDRGYQAVTHYRLSE